MTPQRAHDVARLMMLALILLTVLIWLRLDPGTSPQPAPDTIVTAP